MLTLVDVEAAIACRDPALGEILVRYLAQPDPEPGRSELSTRSATSSDDDDDDDDDDWDDDDDDDWDDDDDDDYDDDDDEPRVVERAEPLVEEPVVEVPAGAFTFAKLTESIGEQALANRTATERKLARRAAFANAEESAFAPPRLRLGNALIALYEAGDPQGRAALLHVFAVGRLSWGVWKATKAIYKLAEARHDAAMFGVLAYRFDAMDTTPYAKKEIGRGTLVYVRRRAWRYLRLLGRATPDAYPTFAGEVLRHYPESHDDSATTWVAGHIWGHDSMDRVPAQFELSDDFETERAYPDAWKLSPAPLLRLLEGATNEVVCDFAIRSLRADHELALRALDPGWLAQLGRRQLGTIHAFVVSVLRDSPTLHQSKLRELGLHDMVIGLLRSPASEARAYALEYAAAYAPDLAVDLLAELVTGGAPEVAKFAAARLEALSPQQLGLGVLLRLLDVAAAPWASRKLAQGFAPANIDVAAFVATAVRGRGAFDALLKFFTEARGNIPAGHWIAIADDPRLAGPIAQTALAELGKRSANEIGVAWIQRSLENRDRTDVVAGWLRDGMLAGDDLDIEWLKSLVTKPRLRPIALELLADRRRVAPARVGLSWLLDLARSLDTDLSQFARRMLLESFAPEDFGGVARLWELAAGKKQPETVRAFAATYLQAHHPDLGTRLPEARALGIAPRLGRDAYAQATVVPLLDDTRPDVRRLAVAIAGEEFERWGDRGLIYDLAASRQPETRAFGIELLLNVLSESPEARRIPTDWVDGRRLFQLAESALKPSREVALTLIRRLYETIGGAERLAWLMDSTDRDVRLFAVRLFWDRHRPKGYPHDYVPRKQVGAPTGSERFADLDALRQFARVVLFGLPPTKPEKRDDVIEGAPKPERALPATTAKRRLIEAMRDVALDEVDLAKTIAPLLGEFSESTAKTEWHASVQALTALRARHGAALQ